MTNVAGRSMEQTGSSEPDRPPSRDPASADAVTGIAAPALAEVSLIWWDVDRVPVVVWDGTGRRFDLVDPDQPEANRLHLALFDSAPDDPAELARVLAEGLASCDFPPSDRRAAPGRVDAALRAARRPERVT